MCEQNKENAVSTPIKEEVDWNNCRRAICFSRRSTRIQQPEIQTDLINLETQRPLRRSTKQTQPPPYLNGYETDLTSKAGRKPGRKSKAAPQPPTMEQKRRRLPSPMKLTRVESTNILKNQIQRKRGPDSNPETEKRLNQNKENTEETMTIGKTLEPDNSLIHTMTSP